MLGAEKMPRWCKVHGESVSEKGVENRMLSLLTDVDQDERDDPIWSPDEGVFLLPLWSGYRFT